MNEQSNEVSDNAQITHSPPLSVSKVWILPIVAVLIGLGMLYQDWKNQGTSIVIEFENAAGLEAKKTKIKYRNVDIGTVVAIYFSEDGASIEAHAEIDKNNEVFLHEDSEFWVVRPRIGSDGISGVGTILSGAYIDLDPGKSDQFATRFVGLENPPISSLSDEGLKLTLVSSGGKSLSVGDPVVYRGFEVGAVETSSFDIDSRKVTYEIFVRAPYDGLITSNTQFWNAGGVTVTASTGGVQVDFASMEAFLSGGVQFDIPEGSGLGNRVDKTREFTLYPSRSSIAESRVYQYLEYVILVEDSVGGLEVGAPVEYRGIQIGSVHRPYMGFNKVNEIDPDETRIPIIVHIEPERMSPDGQYDMQWFKQRMNEWILNGLAARIQTANMLTGNLKVTLDTIESPRESIDSFGSYTVIPASSKGGFDSILSKTDELLSKLSALPLDELVASTNRAVDSANTAIMSANDALKGTETLMLSVEDTLREATITMQGLQPDSETYIRLNNNLQELEHSLLKLQPLLDELRRQPNSLIFGVKNPVDQQPKGSSQQ